MPLLLVTWTTIVLLATVTYHIQLFRNKGILKYRGRFALTVVGVCIFCAILIEIFLRLHEFEMPDFAETAIFYMKFFAICGGAYIFVINLKTKAIKIPIQVALIILMCVNLYAQTWYIFPVVDNLFSCPVYNAAEDKTTVVDHGFLATPNGRFWQELSINFSLAHLKKCEPIGI